MSLALRRCSTTQNRDSERGQGCCGNDPRGPVLDGAVGRVGCPNASLLRFDRVPRVPTICLCACRLVISSSSSSSLMGTPVVLDQGPPQHPHFTLTTTQRPCLGLQRMNRGVGRG